jgi:hypothetical protein
MNTGVKLINHERQSQFGRGFNLAHDKKYTNNELLNAADAHLEIVETGDIDFAREIWPFPVETFRLNLPISSLAKAGALIAAEIDRRIAAGEVDPYGKL